MCSRMQACVNVFAQHILCTKYLRILRGKNVNIPTTVGLVF